MLLRILPPEMILAYRMWSQSSASSFLRRSCAHWRVASEHRLCAALDVMCTAEHAAGLWRFLTISIQLVARDISLAFLSAKVSDASQSV